MELPLAAPNLFIFDYVLPLFVGREVMKPIAVEGTAFGIGAGCFMTAAHCIREGVSLGWMALGTTDGKQLRAWNISAWELVDDYDLAIFQADVSVPVKYFPWHTSELPMATTVKAAGYPYAIEPGRDRMGIRSFVGHVVSATTFGRLAPDPPSYELSFQCPRGLSGAPLLIRHGDSMLTTGIVIGNQRTEMLVFSERESVSDAKEVVTERYEALQLGIALQSRALLDLGPFKVLNGRTIRQHLAEQDLLPTLLA
jgi:Trypsin-like peptidase domain